MTGAQVQGGPCLSTQRKSSHDSSCPYLSSPLSTQLPESLGPITPVPRSLPVPCSLTSGPPHSGQTAVKRLPRCKMCDSRFSILVYSASHAIRHSLLPEALCLPLVAPTLQHHVWWLLLPDSVSLGLCLHFAGLLTLRLHSPGMISFPSMFQLPLKIMTLELIYQTQQLP